MRERIAKIIVGIGFAFGLTAAAFWIPFVWSFDWGHFGSRQWGLCFFFGFLLGTLIVSVSVVLFFVWISSLIEPE
jgi:hypothetical protein